MSNIYVHEPPTNGKVLLLTTVGDIEVELWSKEAPKACKNFVQLCMEGYYDDTIFHRMIKDFIVQGGDPAGDGRSEGESIYGKPFADEFHSRIRFVRRGLVAMANCGVANDNTSHFFFTLAACPELNNKNTIFGRVGGDTIYNMIRMGEGEVEGDRPLYPHKIIKTKILVNPFEDIVPRERKKNKAEKASKPKSQSKATKNFTLLSFGEEAEEDEDEMKKIEPQVTAKSFHDFIEDKNPPQNEEEKEDEEEEEDNEEKREREKKDRLEKVKEVLSKKRKEDENEKRGEKKRHKEDRRKNENEDEDEDYDVMKIGELQESSAKRIEKYKKEAKKLKKELLGNGKEVEEKKEVKKDEEVERLKRDLSSYEHCTNKAVSVRNREQLTLQKLKKFRNATHNATKLTNLLGVGAYEDEEEEKEEEDNEDASSDFSWMTNRLMFGANKDNTVEELSRIKVLDANVDEKDRYDITDPRNAMVVRRRKKK